MARASTAADRLRVFLEWGNVCDAPWANRSLIAGMLRQIPTAADLLPPAARTLYEALPDPVPIWRGCDRGRERGLHWTTNGRDVLPNVDGRSLIARRYRDISGAIIVDQGGLDRVRLELRRGVGNS
jgi:hypothetical protein